MAFKFNLHVVTVALLVSGSLANNDWSKPCFDGTCEYGLRGDATRPTSGTLKIWGSPNSIADITPAGGWEILGCSGSELDQDIQLVCIEGREADCDKLYSSNGATGKVARLPENCSNAPFALISAAWEEEDGVVRRRDGSLAHVLGLRLSAFGKSNPRRRQVETESPVYFAVEAINVNEEDLDTSLAVPRIGARFAPGSDINRRGLFDWISQAAAAIKAATRVKVDNTVQLGRVGFDKAFNLFDKSISCPPHYDMKLKVDVDAIAEAVATLGIFAQGTILPPKIEEFSVAAGLATDLMANLNVTADATGGINTGRITLYKVAIPGINVPGIFTLGPSFQVDADVRAQLDAYLRATVGLKYSSNHVAIFPPRRGDGSSNGEFSLGNTPLKLSVGGNAAVTGSISAHLIPRLDIRANVFANVASASAFLELDGSASMQLSGSTSGGIEQGGSDNPQGVSAFEGCLVMDSGVLIQMGAQAELFGLWADSVNVALLDKDWEIYNKCFNSQDKSAAVRRSLLEFNEPRALACPAASTESPIDIINVVVKSSEIKQL